MANKKTTPPDAQGTDAATNGTADGAAKKGRGKIERVFTSADLGDIRKKENQLNWKFNRAFNQVKKMQLSAESTAAIQDILKKEHAQKSRELLTAQPAAEGKEAESFV